MITLRSQMAGTDAITIDVARGRSAAEVLHHAFATTGIHGHTEMPEDLPPAGVERGSLGGKPPSPADRNVLPYN
jgi:hypothetical protein